MSGAYPRYGHAPIEMRRRLPDLTEQVEEETPWSELEGGAKIKVFACATEKIGDFFWDLRDGRRSLVVAIPCVSWDKRGLASTWTIDHKNYSGASWNWDGDEDKPTLSPSLGMGGQWHGWVRAGELVEA